MKTKLINEDLNNIFKPKSIEEIEKNIKKDPEYEIKNQEDANKHLKAGILRNSIPYVKYALKNNANILNYINEDPTYISHGNLWVAFNYNNSDELILELVKTAEFSLYYRAYKGFRLSVLDKTIMLGKEKVLLWILKNQKNYYLDLHLLI
jgi:hypothetical protein